MVWLTWTGVLALQVMQTETLCAAKKEQATAAIIGAEAPSAQPVAIHTPQQIRMATAVPAADHSAMPWSR